MNRLPSSLTSHRARRRRPGLMAVGALIGLGALNAASSDAAAQSGIELYNGNWVGSAVISADPDWPAVEPGLVTIAIDGDNADFDAEWTSLVLDDGELAWDVAEVEFERADRPGYFAPDDGRADILEGEAQLWAFYGENGLVLGRLQIDEDSGRHIVYTCRMVRNDGGLEATLTMSAADAGPTVATIAMVRR